jgi:hypothetical protein
MVDPRLEPGAYVTDGKRLFEVREIDGTGIVLEDCRDGGVIRHTLGWTLFALKLVRGAPHAPEVLDGDLPES